MAPLLPTHLLENSYKLLVATQAMPKALAPLLVIWLGLGHSSKLAMVFLMCFFPVMVVWFRAPIYQQGAAGTV